MKNKKTDNGKIFDPSLLDVTEYDDAVIGTGSLATHSAVVDDAADDTNDTDGELEIDRGENAGLNDNDAFGGAPKADQAKPANEAANSDKQNHRSYLDDKNDKGGTPLLWGSA